MAWGWWAQETGMAGHLDERDRARMSRNGFVPMSSAEGLALFDAALWQPRSLVVPAQFNLVTIRSGSAVGALPPIFRRLIRATRRSAEPAGAIEASSDLLQRLAAMGESHREQELLKIVRSMRPRCSDTTPTTPWLRTRSSRSWVSIRSVRSSFGIG